MGGGGQGQDAGALELQQQVSSANVSPDKGSAQPNAGAGEQPRSAKKAGTRGPTKKKGSKKK